MAKTIVRLRVISVNVGLPREVPYHGKTVMTGIYKEPVEGRIPVRRYNLDGDEQADLTVHGGAEKAIYAYPSEHYAYWRGQLDRELPWGMFGENLTTEGLTEGSVYVGDRYQIGSAELMVTVPRFPCYKLGIKFGEKAMEKRFLDSGFTGFYFTILREGELATGDLITVLERGEGNFSIKQMVRLYLGEGTPEEYEHAITVPALSDDWRERFLLRLTKLKRA